MSRDTLEPVGLAAIQSLLACPHCRGRLELSAESVKCAGCQRIFPVQDGIPLLAVLDEPEPEVTAHAGPTRTSYQKAYQELDAAADYNTKYERQLLKRWS